MKKMLTSKIKYIIYLIAACFLTIPFFVAACHANYASDDFGYVKYIKINWTGSLFSTAVDTSIIRWRESEGRWFANFYDVFFHPYFWRGTKTLHLLFVVLVLLSVTGLLLFCFAFIKYIGLKSEKTNLLFLILITSIFLFREYWQVYLWFAGTIYQLTTILFLWGFSLLLLAITYRKNYLYILSGILLICMGGCMFNFIGAGCLAIFFLLIVEYYRGKKLNVPLLVVFIFTSASSLLTILAPGNFSRKDSVGGITIFQAIKYSFSVLGKTYADLFSKSVLLGMILIAFVFGLKQRVRLKNNVVLLLVLAHFLMTYATIMPFVYGYNIAGNNIKFNRGYYFIEVTAIVTLVIVCFIAGMTIDKNVKQIKEGAVFAIVFSFLVFGSSLAEMVPIKIATNYLNGKAKTYNDYWIEVFEIAENAPGQDVVIEERIPERVEGTTEIVLKEDPFYDKNRVFLGMFDVKSISILGEKE